MQRGYDSAGRLTSVTDWLGHTTSFSPDPDSNTTGETYPNGTAATNSFDAADRLMSISDARGATGLASFGYGRDGANQLTSTTPTGVTQPNETYTYTPLNQLSTVNTRLSQGSWNLR